MDEYPDVVAKYVLGVDFVRRITPRLQDVKTSAWRQGKPLDLAF